MGQSSEPALDRAIEEWARIVGREWISTEATALRRSQLATYPTRERVVAIIRPASREQVQECVRVANRWRVPLYPVSAGKNWGFGSRVPTLDASVILDLGRLDRIVVLDEDLAYVVVEPGVTQRQLYHHLQERTQGRLWMDATSSSFDSSVLGNLLERGHGVTMYCDHVACACDYEVVLANGECIHTGFGAFENAAVSALDSWGVGPALTGLFSQSNLGIVTRATIWLMRAPEHAEVAFFAIDDEVAFEAIVDGVRPLRLDRILKSGPFFGNVYQGLQKVMTYPWERTAGAVPLAPAVARELAAPHRYGLWSGSIGLCGTREEVALQRERLGQVLEGRVTWSAFVGKDLEGLDTLFPPSRHREVRSVVAGFTGGVGGTSLPSAYWRMGGPPAEVGDMDLDRDGCGYKFWTAIAPFRGRDARRVALVATEVVLRHGFEPAIGMLPVRERTLQFHISCAYDRSIAGQDDAVMACHEELSARLMELGYYPTRLGVGSMLSMDRCDPSYRGVIAAIRHCLDPNNVLAPGRYIPRS